ncbi:MAG: cofactor-independent phosphoglycerate mutase [Actinobacteria bacterium]|nr:cofactor-independent phosphoglycerate mutase [Actinomycetota bacterium]
MAPVNKTKKSKKYIIVLIDGAADYPLAELGNKTPLQAAYKPNMDRLACRGITGIVRTIPEGISPGSDTANLSILGYDPRSYSTGRSSLEAVSIGVKLEDKDIVFRCNLVTLSEEADYAQKTMVDYSAGEIGTEDAKILISDIAEKLGSGSLEFYPGISYRHVLVIKNKPKGFFNDCVLTPPHDISGKKIRHYLPAGSDSKVMLDLMAKSADILKNHPVNLRRQAEGKKAANSIWLWARATKPALDSFYEKYGISGSVISAVDLVKGIGICAGLKAVYVEGATGNINTNYEGKAAAAISELKSGQDFVYIHIEAPDECGHQGNAKDKVKSIEFIDSRVVEKIIKEMEIGGLNYSIMILPDHPTPVSIKTHTSEPVPFLIYNSANKTDTKNKMCACENHCVFDEFYSKSTGLFIEDGHKLMDYFLKD